MYNTLYSKLKKYPKTHISIPGKAAKNSYTTPKYLLFCIVLILVSSIELQAQDSLSLSKRWSNAVSTWPIDFSTSVELRNAFRINNRNDLHDVLILGEPRWQLGLGAYLGSWGEAKGKIDLGYDYALKKGLVDLRELNIDIYPQSWWNLKIGRQVLTWGKGDLVFINDLFPKDYPSFFSGRDIQYLKAPNDALKLTINPSWIQINLIYSPQFDPDRFLEAERISFYDANIQMYRGMDNLLPTDLPNRFFKEDEWYWRIQKEIKGIEIAGYGYHGYWKSPGGFDTSTGNYTFPKLNVYGFSIEGSIAGGILAVEGGFYDSGDDRDGMDPFINNGEFRWLINYDRDFKKNFSVGIQYYSEIMTDYENHVAALTALGATPENQFHDMLTLRLKKLINKQRVEFGLFTFYSIRDNDVYLRPNVVYKINDFWKINAGCNIFMGESETTFWNQLRFNNNIYFGVKWGI